MAIAGLSNLALLKTRGGTNRRAPAANLRKTILGGTAQPQSRNIAGPSFGVLPSTGRAAQGGSARVSGVPSFASGTPVPAFNVSSAPSGGGSFIGGGGASPVGGDPFRSANRAQRNFLNSQRAAQQHIAAFGEDHPGSQAFLNEVALRQRQFDDANIRAAGGGGGGGSLSRGLGGGSRGDAGSPQGLAHELAQQEFDQRGFELGERRDLQNLFNQSNQRLGEFQTKLGDFFDPALAGGKLPGTFENFGQGFTPEQAQNIFQDQFNPVQEAFAKAGLTGQGPELEARERLAAQIALQSRLLQGQEQGQLLNAFQQLPGIVGQAPNVLEPIGDPQGALRTEQAVLDSIFGRDLAERQLQLEQQKLLQNAFSNALSRSTLPSVKATTTGTSASGLSPAEEFIRADRLLQDHFRQTLPRQSALDFTSFPGQGFDQRVSGAADTVLANLFGFDQFPSNATAAGIGTNTLAQIASRVGRDKQIAGGDRSVSTTPSGKIRIDHPGGSVIKPGRSKSKHKPGTSTGGGQ